MGWVLKLADKATGISRKSPHILPYILKDRYFKPDR